MEMVGISSFAHWTASPLWAPVLDASQAKSGTAGHKPKGIGKKAICESKSQERALGNSQTTVATVDGAARSVRAIEACVKADSMTPAYPLLGCTIIQRFPTAWLRGSEPVSVCRGFAPLGEALPSAKGRPPQAFTKVRGQEGY